MRYGLAASLVISVLFGSELSTRGQETSSKPRVINLLERPVLRTQPEGNLPEKCTLKTGTSLVVETPKRKGKAEEFSGCCLEFKDPIRLGSLTKPVVKMRLQSDENVVDVKLESDEHFFVYKGNLDKGEHIVGQDKEVSENVKNGVKKFCVMLLGPNHFPNRVEITEAKLVAP